MQAAAARDVPLRRIEVVREEDAGQEDAAGGGVERGSACRETGVRAGRAWWNSKRAAHFFSAPSSCWILLGATMSMPTTCQSF